MELFDLEKLKPTSLNEMVLYKALRTALETYVEHGEFKTLLFHGNVGLGKTTAANIIMRACEKKRHTNLLEMNCAQVDSAAEMKKLVKSIQSGSLFGNNKKLYLLDEFHMIPASRQAMLNIPLEKSKDQFILCVNNADKISDPILSRSRPLNFDHATLNASATKITMLPHTNMTVDEYKNEVFRVARIFAKKYDVDVTDDELNECADAKPRRLTDMRYFMLSLNAQLREKHR
jgi:replication-associated recombination protein RarA